MIHWEPFNLLDHMEGKKKRYLPPTSLHRNSLLNLFFKKDNKVIHKMQYKLFLAYPHSLKVAKHNQQDMEYNRDGTRVGGNYWKRQNRPHTVVRQRRDEGKCDHSLKQQRGQKVFNKVWTDFQVLESR